MKYLLCLFLVACSVESYEPDAGVSDKAWRVPWPVPVVDARPPDAREETLWERKVRYAPTMEARCVTISDRQIGMSCASDATVCRTTCVNEYWNSPTSCFWTFDTWSLEELHGGPDPCGSWVGAPWSYWAQDTRQAFLLCRFGGGA